MAERIALDEQTNYETFRDCLSEPVLKALAAPVEKPRKKKRSGRKSRNSKDDTSDQKEQGSGSTGEQATAEDLGEFIDVRIYATSKGKNKLI